MAKEEAGGGVVCVVRLTSDGKLKVELAQGIKRLRLARGLLLWLHQLLEADEALLDTAIDTAVKATQSRILIPEFAPPTDGKRK